MSDYETRKTLLVRIRDPDDDRAWNEFSEIYTPLIYNYCIRRGLQQADASDIVQEVMRSLAGAIKNFEYDRDKGTFRSWIYTITRNKLNDWFSRHRRQPQGTGDSLMLKIMDRMQEKDAESQAADEWDLAYRRHVFEWAASRVRGEFQDQTWKAFWKTAVEEVKPAEAAREIGMSLGAIYVAKSRVVARLRTEIKSISGDPDPGTFDFE